MKPRRVVLPAFEDRDLDQQTKRRERRRSPPVEACAPRRRSPIPVHDADRPIRRIATRGNRNQHSPAAYRFPVPAGMLLRQTSDF